MRKFIFIMLFSFVGILGISQEKGEVLEKTGKAVKGSVETVYEDGKKVIGTVYNDGVSVIETAYDDVKYSVEYITPIIEDAVRGIADGLKIGATELWRILVLKQVVYSVVYTIILLLMLLLVREFNKEKKTYLLSIVPKTKTEDIAYIPKNPFLKHWIFMGIYLGGVVITGSIFFSNIVPFAMGYINPEYGALIEILDYASKMMPK